MTDESRAARLSDEQFAEVMELIKGSDTVELKVTIPTTGHRATIQGLGIDPVEAQPRQVFFFDTPDLRLFEAGVVVRARRRPGGIGDTVIKLRPVTPTDLSPELRKEPAFNVEVDLLPGGFVCSASYKGRIPSDQVRDAAAGQGSIRKLFTKEQRAFYADHAPEGLDLDTLVTLGPTFILKAEWHPPELDRDLVGEMWLYPDGSRILELSTKCLPNETFQVSAEARHYLISKGVQLGPSQQTKTRTALEFYQGQLRAEAEPTAAAAS